MPAVPGVYVLHVASAGSARIVVGGLGTVALDAGHYLYVGSAHGPGGIRARLGRHIRGQGSTRWHIDHLRAALTPLGAWFGAMARRREHQVAAALARLADGAVAGFGCSDCRCASHLFYFNELPPRASLARALAGGDGELAWSGPRRSR